MTDPASTDGLPSYEQRLERLARNAGVKASLVLDRASGAILKSGGDTSILRTTEARAAAASLSNEPAAQEASAVEGFAALLWEHVRASEKLALDLDREDELRLLRLRLRRQEVVVVPDAKYILVVVHDAPAA